MSSAALLALDDLPMAAMLCDAHGAISHYNEAAESLLVSMGFKKPFALTANALATQPQLHAALEKHRSTGARVKLRDQEAREWWLTSQGTCTLIIAYNLDEDKRAGADDGPPLSSHMAAALAHEIRNPLLSIKGAAKLLEDVVVDARDKTLAELIHRETERVEGLMRNLDPLSPSAHTAMVPLNIHEVIQHAREAVASIAPQVVFVSDYDPSIPDILGDHERLVQVMVNLFKNACEAMAGTKDAQIHISTRVLPLSQAKRVHGRQQPVCVTIRDTGPGIDVAMREHLFTPFVSGNAYGKGLGLSIAAAILHQHHGVIEYAPTASGNAQFHVYLPLEKGLRNAG